jgi:hypothetical protein
MRRRPTRGRGADCQPDERRAYGGDWRLHNANYGQPAAGGERRVLRPGKSGRLRVIQACVM